MSGPGDLTITVTLTQNQAWEFAQFLKRARLTDYLALSEGERKARYMFDAGELILKELAEAGYAPR